MRLLQALAVGSLVGLCLWHAGPAHADFIGHGAPVRDIVISGDGGQALTAGFDDQVILWDVETRSEKMRLVGHDAAVNAVAFLPDGSGRAVSVSDDGSLRLWELRTGAEEARLTGHSKKVVSVAASPDGKLVASAAWDRTVRLWEVANGHQLQVFKGHKANVNAVQFTPDGRHLVSGGYDGEIWFWPLDETRAPSALPSSVSPSATWRFPRTGPGWWPAPPISWCGSSTWPAAISCASWRATRARCSRSPSRRTVS